MWLFANHEERERSRFLQSLPPRDASGVVWVLIEIENLGRLLPLSWAVQVYVVGDDLVGAIAVFVVCLGMISESVQKQ
jgi:hypothetical protein